MSVGVVVVVGDDEEGDEEGDVDEDVDEDVGGWVVMWG